MNEILHEETLTIILVVGIFLAFIFLLIETRRSKSKGNLANKYRTISAFPGFISTLGVLGTFIGITKGLMFFDTNDLDNSIPKLLSGLKLAFITSLMGMIGSLILSRIINHLYDKQERESGQEDNALSALNKLVNVMKDSIDRQEKRAVKQEENTSAILHKIEEIHLGLLCSSEQQSDRMTRLTDIISDYTDSKNTFDQITVILDSIHQEVTGGSLSMRQLASLIQEETTIISKGLEQIENSIANSNELMGEKFVSEFKGDTAKWQMSIGRDLSMKFKNPSVLFAQGSYELTTDFQQILNDFLPRYLDILLRDSLRNNIKEIRIEGHTDDVPIPSYDQDPYIANVILSQQRALSVLRYLRTSASFQHYSDYEKQLLEFWFTSNGLSFGRALDAHGQYTLESGQEIDKAKSRRVEFRIVTKGDEVLENFVNENK